MVNGASRRNKFFRPRNRLVILYETTQPPADTHDGRSGVEVASVGGPSKPSTQVWQLSLEPLVCLELSRPVPYAHRPGFTSREVSGVGGSRIGGIASVRQLFLGELADCLQHRIPGMARRPVRGDQRFAH